MGWVPTREKRIRWQHPGGRIRASAAAPSNGSPTIQERRAAVLTGLSDGSLTPDTGRVLVGRVLSASDATAEQRQGIERLAEHDVPSALEAAWALLDAGGDVAASAPRHLPQDGERIVAEAVRAGKFSDARREFWLRRYRDNPQATTATIEALEPLPVFLSAKGKGGSDESLVGAVSPQAALRLGYVVARPNPLGENLPGRVQTPPPPRRVHVIGDRA